MHPETLAALLIGAPLAAAALGALPTILAVMVEGPRQSRPVARRVRA